MFIRDKGKRVSSELISQLEEKVKELVETAIKRADKNRRSTVMPHDL
jgi:histone H3/H4